MQMRSFKILLLVSRCMLSSNSPTHRTNYQRLPAYITPCYRDDPMLAECVKFSLYHLARKLANGIPELDVPAIEPLYYEEIDAFNVAGFRLKITNIAIWGASKLRVTWNSASEKTKVYDFEGIADTMVTDATYELTGYFFVPIRAAGTIHGIGRHFDFRVNSIVDALPKDGVDFIKINDINVKVYINDGSVWITNLGPFEGAINKMLNNLLNGRLILNHVAMLIEKLGPSVLQKYGNRILNSLKYDAVLINGSGPVSHGTYRTSNNYDCSV